MCKKNYVVNPYTMVIVQQKMFSYINYIFAVFPETWIFKKIPPIPAPAQKSAAEQLYLQVL